MSKEKALILALLVGLILLGQRGASAQEGGNAAPAVAIPGVNHGIVPAPGIHLARR